MEDEFVLPDLPTPATPPPPAEVLNGRPTILTKELTHLVIETIATTPKGIKTICEELGIGYNTFRTWVRENEKFRYLYQLAKEEQADSHLDEALEEMNEAIAERDTAGAMMAKLRVDSRFKIAALLNPTKYGKKNETTINVNTNDHTKSEFQDILEAVKRKKAEKLNAERNGGFEEAQIV